MASLARPGDAAGRLPPRPLAPLTAQHEHAVGAESPRIGERGGLHSPAPARDRGEVAAGGTLLPDPVTLGDQLRDAVTTHPLPLGDVLGDREADPLGDPTEVLERHVAGDVLLPGGDE